AQATTAAQADLGSRIEKPRPNGISNSLGTSSVLCVSSASSASPRWFLMPSKTFKKQSPLNACHSHRESASVECLGGTGTIAETQRTLRLRRDGMSRNNVSLVLRS